MQFDPVLIPPRQAAMTAAGLWRDRTIQHYLDQALAHCPDKTAVVAYRADRPHAVRLSYRELVRRADRIAASLYAMGMRASDVVSFQLPKRWPEACCRN